MLDDFISALISLAIALIVAFPLGKALKKHPVPFYLAALVLVAAHLTYKYTGTYIAGAQIFIDIMQKGYLAVFLLAIVMFIGVFDEGSPIRRKLQPIRAELSILSFLLILSHVLAFLPNYLPRLGAIFSSHIGMSVSIIMATLLILVFALLHVEEHPAPLLRHGGAAPAAYRACAGSPGLCRPWLDVRPRRPRRV